MILYTSNNIKCENNKQSKSRAIETVCAHAVLGVCLLVLFIIYLLINGYHKDRFLLQY